MGVTVRKLWSVLWGMRIWRLITESCRYTRRVRGCCNEPIALVLALVPTAAVAIALWVVVAAAPVVVPVVKTAIATAIAATEILHMLVLIESLNKCMDNGSGLRIERPRTQSE